MSLIDQSFNVNIVFLTLLSSSVSIQKFTDAIRIFPAYAFACHSDVLFMPCEWLNIK